jgi:hypothetical protein
MNISTHITKTFKIASAFGVFAIASAQGATFGSFEYKLETYQWPPVYEAVVTGWIGAPTDLAIPSNIDDPDHGEIEVVSIDNNAFEDCTSLRTIMLPDTLANIRSDAFKGCAKLADIRLPSSLNSIGGNAFQGCVSLMSITLPNALVDIESSTFEGCRSLLGISFPDTLANIRSNAFKGCVKLANITLPSSLNWIGDNAFEGCTSLTSITLPDETNAIGWDTFKGCDNLVTINLGVDFEGIGYGYDEDGYYGDSEELSEQLAELPKLANINVSAKNEDFTSVEGVLYSKDKTELISFPAGRTGNFTIPSHVKEIGQFAFSNSKLTSITIPETVTYIAEDTFEGASQLQSISIPDKFITELGNMRVPGQLALATLIKSATNNGLFARSELPQAVEKALADIESSLGPAPIITSDLANMYLLRGRAMTYSTTTNFSANAFSAVGLPLGLNINPVTGVISGKPSKKGTYSAFIHAGIPGGATTTSVKMFIVQ